MLKFALPLVAAFGLLIAATGVSVADHHEKPGPATTQAAGPINKFCAIEQEHPIDPEVVIEYQGKIVGFCCKDCIDEFKKDPEKYLKNIK